MNARTTIAIGGLLAVVVGLGVALGVVLATDDANDAGSVGHRMAAGGGPMSMMVAMGGMDSGTFVDHMRDVLGEGRFGRMLDHLREHQDGGLMTGGQAAGDMMHRMMDGVMEHMPADKGGVMPSDPDTHHETPAPRATPGQ